MLAALDLAHVRPLDAGHVSQRFLSDTLVGSLFPHGSPKRDGWFRFVGSGAGGAAPLDRTLWHCQERRTRRSEEHTSELQSLMRISYAVFCLKKKKTDKE